MRVREFLSWWFGGLILLCVVADIGAAGHWSVVMTVIVAECVVLLGIVPLLIRRLLRKDR
jgi:hypothetical protein